MGWIDDDGDGDDDDDDGDEMEWDDDYGDDGGTYEVDNALTSAHFPEISHKATVKQA